MRMKLATAATTAALFLAAAGWAQAQSSPPPASSSSPPSAGAPAQTMPRATTDSSASGRTGSLDRGTLHEVKSDSAMVKNLNVNAKDLRAMSIYGADGKKIGEVKNVLADKSNAIKAVSSDVGGFLGMGSREVVFPIDKLRKGTEKNRLQTSLTKDEIKNLEAWSDTGSSSTSTVSPRPASPGMPPSTR